MSDKETPEAEEQTGFTDWFVNEMAREEEPETATPETASSDEPEEPEVEAEASEEGETQEEEQAEEAVEESAEAKAAETDTEETQTYTVTVGGKESEVTLEELVKGYQLESDYTRKTQALAEERKKLEAERTELATKQQQQAESLNSVREELAKKANVLSQEEIDKLYDEDPNEWAVQRERKRAFEEQFEAQQQQSRESQETLLRQQVQACWEKIPEVIEEWKDLNESQGEIREVAKYLVAQGLPESQVTTMADPLAWKIVRKAYLYDKVEQAKPTIRKKVADAPRMVKSGTPKTTKTSQMEKEKRAAARLKKTGSGFTDWLMESGNV